MDSFSLFLPTPLSLARTFLSRFSLCPDVMKLLTAFSTFRMLFCSCFNTLVTAESMSFFSLPTSVTPRNWRRFPSGLPSFSPFSFLSNFPTEAVAMAANCFACFTSVFKLLSIFFPCFPVLEPSKPSADVSDSVDGMRVVFGAFHPLLSASCKFFSSFFLFLSVPSFLAARASANGSVSALSPRFAGTTMISLSSLTRLYPNRRFHSPLDSSHSILLRFRLVMPFSLANVCHFVIGLLTGYGFSRGRRNEASGSFAMNPSSVSIIGNLKTSPIKVCAILVPLARMVAVGSLLNSSSSTGAGSYAYKSPRSSSRFPWNASSCNACAADVIFIGPASLSSSESLIAFTTIEVYACAWFAG
mmetsp:Transcript_37141/g.62513  ORF Transcript_37141/g.62513 Transcript_37141/m.62513 type:complete len:358 (-) Transcript_37141:54-1127(-)